MLSLSTILVALILGSDFSTTLSFPLQSILPTNHAASPNKSILSSNSNSNDKTESTTISRREWGEHWIETAAVIGAAAAFAKPVHANDFTPGGTLVDRKVGVQVGNDEASPSRKPDNANVLFYQDYYFKFGTAAPWLEPDSTEFPKTMPFTRVQQRYDAIQKYQGRILAGLEKIKALDSSSSLTDAADPTAVDVYALRPMGLLANSMLASENSGASNELFLARWYINESYLLISDMRSASSPEQAQAIASAVKKATNSYLTMMNRVITPKIGNKFEYL